MRTLSPNTTLLDGPGLWMETNGVDQLQRVAAFPGCAAAAGMPDLHAGKGPVGAAFAFTDGAHPALIGGDAGCGARATALAGLARPGLDALERRARELMAEPALDGVDPAALVIAAWTEGPRGLARLPGMPEALAELAQEPPDGLPPSSAPPDPERCASQLGTIGGGNHFLELGEVSTAHDKDRAKNAGFSRGALVVLAHSGSRGLGGWLASRWPADPAEALQDEALAAFSSDLAGACRFARANRLLLTWRLLRAVGGARRGKVSGGVDLTHNAVWPWSDGERSGWLHRKGAAPAEKNQLTVVLGSRGAPSELMEGLGAAGALCTVAHGAGRKLDRSSALNRMKHRYHRDQLLRTKLGSRVICDDANLLYEEHPEAYKPIGPVIDALEAAGAARRIASITPLLTIKV